MSLLFPFGFSLSRTMVILLAVGVLMTLDVIGRIRGKPSRYVFGVILGTILSLGLIEVLGILLNPSTGPHVFGMALGILLIVIAWRMLFGPWDAPVKATVLGTFIFWILFSVIIRETPDQRLAHLIAIGVAAVPAVVWCLLFLPYHRERLSVVFSLFFAGMLSTVPILFYDALAKRQIELHFFLFRIVPESFSRSAESFVGAQFPGLTPVSATLSTMVVSFVIVSLIEEGSKFWVLKKTGGSCIRSIDDALQFGILVAIGFAFAENIVPTGYFLTFAKEYLLRPDGVRDWGSFFGNVAGRSVLTTMVHIVSTGLMGYFLGIATFAGPYLRESEARGRKHLILKELHALFGFPIRDLFRREMLLVGFFLAVFLHTLSNTLVSLPDVLPGNPRTLGALLGSPTGSPFNLIALLLLPTLLYVGGGFCLVTSLFLRAENRKERGHLVTAETFVTEDER